MLYCFDKDISGHVCCVVHTIYASCRGMLYDTSTPFTAMYNVLGRICSVNYFLYLFVSINVSLI